MAEKTKEEAADQPKADTTAVKMVAVRALRPFKGPKGIVVQPGTVVQVPEAMAVKLTKASGGPFSFRGERYTVDGDAHRASLAKAVRVEAAA